MESGIDLEEIIQCLHECFVLDCLSLSGITGYDHYNIDAYKKAQEILIKLGRIKSEECLRK